MIDETLPPSQETVFIVDDDASIREGLVNLLEAVGIPSQQFPSAEDFLRAWDPSHPGCLVLDVRLPGITGVEFQERLRASATDIPIIFMTAHGDIPMVRKVMKAGAIEFLTKPFEKRELLTAIEHAFARDRARRSQDAALAPIRKRYESLTPREREVMRLVTAGLLNKQIADELDLSEITVKVHRRNLLGKMRAESLADLVKMAERIRIAGID